MAKHAKPPAQSQWLPSAFLWVGRGLLLVPEAALLLLLLCLYPLVAAPELALLIAVLILTFTMRLIALHLARAAIETGHYTEASALLAVARLLYPYSADALALSGTLALARNQPERAEIKLRRAIALLPGQPGLHTALSSALLEQGRPGEAAEAARLAIAINPQHALAYLYLAEAEGASGATPEAVEERLRNGMAVAVAPEAGAALQCALASHLMAEHRLAEAMLALRAAESLLPQCSTLRQAELRYLLGELFVAQGQTERAREHFQGAQTLDPKGRYATAAWRTAQL